VSSSWSSGFSVFIAGSIIEKKKFVNKRKPLDTKKRESATVKKMKTFEKETQTSSPQNKDRVNKPLRCHLLWLKWIAFGNE
jgi:hypothetical protein